MSSYKDFWPIVAIEGAKVGKKSGPVKEPADRVVKAIRRATRQQFSAEDKIRSCAVRFARRGQHRRAVSPRRDRPESLVKNSERQF
jgi:transposase